MCVSIFGMRFSPPGWHYFTQEILQRLADPDTPLRDSVLFKYYAETRVSEQDFFPCLRQESYRYRPGLLYAPWGTGTALRAEDPGVHQFGPKPRDFTRSKRRHLMRVFRQLQRTGYRPNRQKNNYIRGTMLTASDGRQRFLVCAGQHRTAALAALGVESFRARFQPGWPREVREDDASSWEAVRSGAARVEEAREFFRSYFDLPDDSRKPASLQTIMECPHRTAPKVPLRASSVARQVVSLFSNR